MKPRKTAQQESQVYQYPGGSPSPQSHQTTAALFKHPQDRPQFTQPQARAGKGKLQNANTAELIMRKVTNTAWMIKEIPKNITAFAAL